MLLLLFNQATSSGGGTVIPSGTTYPLSMPLRTLVTGNVYVALSWIIPAVGVPGSTGTQQAGNTSVVINTATTYIADDLLDVVDEMLRDGRAKLY